MAEPSRVRMASRLPERSEKCSRACAAGASYWPADGGLSDRTTMVQGDQPAALHIRPDYWSGPLDWRGNVPTSSQTPNICKCLKIWLSFWENTSYDFSLPLIQPSLGGPMFVAVPEAYFRPHFPEQNRRP